jgi:hypothetical protein
VQDAIFWTFQPLKEDPGAAIKAITEAWSVLEKDFGPLDKNIHAPHIVESTGLRNHVTGDPGPAAVAFPGGALVDSQALALGIGTEDFLERVTHALAHNWFGDEVFFAPDAALGMGEGLPEYATIVVEESAKGEAGRRQRVARYLHEYDRARSGANESPLGVTMLTDSIEQRSIALAKAPLFFVAIEDACGEGSLCCAGRRPAMMLCAPRWRSPAARILPSCFVSGSTIRAYRRISGHAMAARQPKRSSKETRRAQEGS